MGTIRNLRKRVDQLNLRNEVPKIIEATGKDIIQRNQDQLYKQSVDSLGVPLQLYSSAAYSIDKAKLNSAPGFGRPDLKLTGDFYRGFNVTSGLTGVFTIDSTDSKTGKLEAKYGNHIFGLTDASKESYTKLVFRPRLQAYIERTTGLSFR